MRKSSLVKAMACFMVAQTSDGTLVTFTPSENEPWDWDNFKTFIKNAHIIANVTRTGNDFKMHVNIKGGNDKELEYTVAFTVNAAEKLTLFYTTDTATFTINSFTNKADYLVSLFPNVKYDSVTDCYMVPISDTTIVKSNDDNTEFPYLVDESKMFVDAFYSGCNRQNSNSFYWR